MVRADNNLCGANISNKSMYGITCRFVVDSYIDKRSSVKG